MSDAVIQVAGLSKRYRIGANRNTESLRHALEDSIQRFYRRCLGRPVPPKSPYKDFWALKEVSFEVTRGECVGIIGRNGAGKSTLLKILSRITDPTEGEVRITGRVASLLEVGTGFHPELTGRENIFLNGAILGMKRTEIRKKFDEIVAFSEVENFLDTPVKYYSSGMYVRLAFGVAAHLEPEILIVDEVLAVGDAGFQKKCLNKMGEVGREGRTVLVVSHNMSVVANLCQRTVLMKSGQIHAHGPTHEIIGHYLATEGTATGDMVWSDPTTAPGTDLVRLHRVRILQPGLDGPTVDVDISKEVIVEIEYWNLCAGSPLYAALWLKDHMGVAVLSTSSSVYSSLGYDSWNGKPHPVGLFRSQCRFPGNFLNEGRYFITPIVGKTPDKTQILLEDILSFEVHDTGEMRKEYYGHWIGTVRPKLPWQSDFLGNSSTADSRMATSLTSNA